MLRIALFALNLVVSAASTLSAILALIRPASLSNSINVLPGEVFYARMYAARSIPVGFATGLLPFLTRHSTAGWVVLAGAIIQLCDVGVAAVKRAPRMVIGASIGTIVHLLCGAMILRRKDE